MDEQHVIPAEWAENGSSERTRVFGEGGKVLDEWVEPMLHYLYEHHRRALADAILHAMGMELPTRGRPRADA